MEVFMSMQIIYGKVVGNEVLFEKGNHGVNMTESLKKNCYDFFVEKTYLEDGEEISYRTMDYEVVKKFLIHLIEIEKRTWKELKEAKGNTLKEEKAEQLRDYSLVKDQIAGMLLQDCDDNCKLLVLI